MEELREQTPQDRTKQPVACYHCGDVCREQHVQFDEKDFCCNGCKVVYEILHDNDLCTYYDLGKNPGISLRSKDFGDKYQYLDNPEIVALLADYLDDKRALVTFHIPAIHCSSCIWLLENLYKLRDGITHTRVNFTRKRLQVDFDREEISLRAIVELLTTIGYEPLISLQDEKGDGGLKANRGLYLRIGIAGFAFGNIMLLSFPEYFGFAGLDDVLLQRFISYLNILLAIPVVFYCASGYFRSAIGGLRQGYFNIDVPITLGIFVLFSRSIYEIIVLHEPGYLDSLAGLVFFLLVGRWFQEYTYQGLSFDRDYRSYFPLAVQKEVPEGLQSVPISSLQEGDVITIRNMEIIPADSELLTDSASLDYSFVTGESDPVPKRRYDLVYAGGRQVGPRIRLRVVKAVSQSYLMQLWNNDVFDEQRNRGFGRLIDKISRHFTYAVLFCAAVAFLWWFRDDFTTAMNALTAVLIIACPCALALAGPFTYGTAMRILGMAHFFLKKTGILEDMVKIDAIVFDKTGTITRNNTAQLEYAGQELNETVLAEVAALAVNSNHPHSRSLTAHIGLVAASGLKVDDFMEVPGKGVAGSINGADLRLGSFEFVSPAGDGGDVPVDGFDTSVHVSRNGLYLGRFMTRNVYREGIGEMVKELSGDYDLAVLTGDNIGERKNLARLFPVGTRLRFNQSPQAKLDFIRTLQRQGRKVLMIGDGLNDAGALKQSDLGITVTEDLTNFTPASDGIIHASALPGLARFLRFAFVSRRIIVAAFVISFLYNAIGIGVAMAGLLTPLIAAILMPLSSISVVAFATATTNLMARIKGLR